jgi:hypothetical protein
MHRARYIAVRLAAIGDFYGAVLDAAAKGMDRAVALRLNPNLGISQARQDEAPTLQAIHTMLVNDVYPEMNRVADDRRIATTIRDGLVHAWSTCIKMKTSIDNPEGTTESHKADASTLKELHREVMERLRSDLNFTETLR